jgi:anti-sigma factor RsiW
VQCAEALRVQAFFDHELDAISSVDVERHLEHCAECRALLQDLGQVRVALRRDLAYERATPVLRARVLETLDEESGAAPPESNAAPVPSNVRRLTPKPKRTFLLGAFSGAGGMALAAALAFFLVVPTLTSSLTDGLVSAHVRSLMPDHLIDVVSTDKHTVKPWFAGHADVSPAVADFATQGYTLVGGRADYFEGQRAAVTVYRHGAHAINVFSWAGSGILPRDSTRNGYHLAFFREGNLDYCAVSDTGWDELHGLVSLLKDLSQRENAG